MLIVERGVRGISPKIFIVLEVNGCDFNSLHDSFISVRCQTCRPQNVKAIHECQVAKV